MEATDVKRVARSYFEELINKHNLGFIETLFDPAIEFHDPAIVPSGLTTGLGGVRGFFTFFFSVFPDVNFTIEELFAEDDRVAIRFNWTGTHRATFLGIPITERHVSVPGIDTFRIVNGKIAEVRVAFDRLMLIEQLGGISPPL
ncbi:MAG TPA: ester cyclase [Chloroflexota bacterium]|jgi:steroid delta-isomerase-like uncharacterized protein